jgi:hypothetical protein
MSQFFIFFQHCEAPHKRNVIHYGADKLANVKETLNGVGIERFEFYFTVRWTSKNRQPGVEEEAERSSKLLTGSDH